MKSKKQIFIEQIEILEKQLKMKKMMNEVNFRNDVSLLFLMLHEITRDIHNTKTPLTELVELNKLVIGLDLIKIPLDELICLLKKYFSNIDEIKSRLKLGCLCIDVAYLSSIKEQAKKLKENIKCYDENKIELELRNFSEVLLSCFNLDLKLVEEKNTNNYSDEEKKLLNLINSFTSLNAEKSLKQFKEITHNKLFNQLMSV